jgi:ferritin-like metal-binding protein YciE
MANPEDNFTDWLRDAHAMEKQAETMLTSMAGRLEHYPDLKARIERHVEETRHQAHELESCLERRGVATSAMKDFAGRMAAMGQGLTGMMASDEVVKGAMAGYAFEHMEIAAYRTLIAAAEAVGDAQTKAVCERILAEEVAMADWLEQHLPSVAQTFLQRDAQPETVSKY